MTKIKVQIADSEDLKGKIFHIRKVVFVDEQKVSAEEEFDEYEDICTHFIAWNDEEPVGAARWRTTEKGVKLERFAVLESARGMGVGSALVSAVIDDIQTKLGSGKYLYLHGQLTAVPLYEKFGFEKKGDIFSECDILHYLMWRYS